MASSFDNDSRRFFLLQVLGWAALGAVVYGASANWLMHTAGAQPWQLVVRAGWWGLLGVGLSTLLGWGYQRLLPDAAITPARLILMGLCSLAAGIAFTLIFDAWSWPLPPDGVTAMRAARTKSAWARAISPSLAMMAWSATWVGVQNGKRLRQERERALRAEALAVEARLAMLRYELNPHFLFNALNSIVGAIDESPVRAKQMVRQLAELLRHTLHGSNASSTLADEVQAARLYLALEQARFEEKLQVTIDIPSEAASWPMPAMLLQPLVENAVKHGMRTSPLPLIVEVIASVKAGRLQLLVRNTGKLQPGNVGVGLRNLRDRLVHLDSATFELRQHDDRVEALLELAR